MSSLAPGASAVIEIHAGQQANSAQLVRDKFLITVITVDSGNALKITDIAGLMKVN